MSQHGAQACVIALGSSHGDDQAAWIAAARLRDRVASNVRVVAVSEPTRLLDHLAGCSKLIVVDACCGESDAGSVVRFEWPNERVVALRSSSSHHVGLTEVLQLADALGKIPPQVLVYAIQIQSTHPGDELSPPVSDGLTELIRAVERELNA